MVEQLLAGIYITSKEDGVLRGLRAKVDIPGLSVRRRIFRGFNAGKNLRFLIILRMHMRYNV